jgi:hypothetical protein
MIPSEEELENRFTYHVPKENQPLRYERIRGLAYSFAAELNHMCPDSREKDEALTHLDAVVFNANAAIARRS